MPQNSIKEGLEEGLEEGKTSEIICSVLRDIKIDSSLLVKSITYD